MKNNVKLGVVCLARNTFDFNAAKDIYEDILKQLESIPKLTVCAVKQLVMEIDDAQNAAKELYANNVDGIAIISGTFHLGHLALEMKKVVDKPLLLWGMPELPYNGGKIRLNSVCGVNLNASNLVKSGHTDFVYIVDDKIDENFIDALRIKAAMSNARIGILGHHAHGFFNTDVDELALYKQFGTLIEHFELKELWDYDYKEEDNKYFYDKILQTFDVTNVTKKQIELVCQLSAKLKAFYNDKKLNALAIRCWPEFAQGFGIAPCAAMSLLQSQDMIFACEGDIDCALTMLCHQAAGAETPFMADLSQVNLKENYALMWHCGVAPCNLCDGDCTPTLDTYFAAGKGVTAGFVMKPGDINFARFDSINGKYRLIQQKGKALPMQKQLTGTYAKAQFEQDMQSILDKVVYNGIAHHVSMVYGDYTKAMSIFAKIKKIEEIL